MENLIFTTIEVESLEEVKPLLQINKPSTLSLKITMSKYALAAILYGALESLSIEEVNEAIGRDGFNLTYKEN